MGTFAAAIEIGDPSGNRFETVEVLVDTGSTYTWLPESLLSRVGVQPITTAEFETADGRVIGREMGQTWVRVDGRSVITLVVFAAEHLQPLLGAYTLEGLRLGVDPVNRRLVPVRGLAMGLGRG